MAEHDNAYKSLFSHPPVVEDFLRGFVHEDWVAEVDFATLEKMSGSYVTDDLRDREDDIVWRVRCNGEWLYVYLLLEFQSSNDPWMALRILVYTGLLYQDLIKRGEVIAPGQLPPVFPAVIYNGLPRWTAAREVAELIQALPTSLQGYIPRQRYYLLDEGRLPATALSHDNLMSDIIRVEGSPEPQALREVIGQLDRRLRGPGVDSLRRAFTVWINRIVVRRLDSRETIPETSSLQEIDTMLAERVVEWTEKWKQEGLLEGRQEGLQQGLQEGIREGLQQGKAAGRIEGEVAVLKRQLARRFGPLSAEVLTRIDGASIDQLERWADNILDAGTLDDVFND